MRLRINLASGLICSMMARSVRVPSSVTRIVLYMAVQSAARDDLPGGFDGLRETIHIHECNQYGAAPTGQQEEAAGAPEAHAFARAGEMQEREHGEGELKREHDLAEGEEVVDAAIAAQADDQDGRYDGECAGEQAAQPGGELPVHEAFHDHLSGERAGDGAALATGEEGNGEEDASGGGAEQGSERQEGNANPIGVAVELDDLSAGDGDTVAAVEDHGGEHEDGGVDEEGDGQRDGGINGIEADGVADGVIVALQFARLDQGGVEIEIMRHDGGADHADGDVEHAGTAESGMSQGAGHFAEGGTGFRQHENLDEVTGANGGDEEENDGFDAAHAQALESEQEKDVGGGADDGPEQGNVEEESEGDGAAEDFGEVAGADGEFAHDPVGPAGPGRIPIPAAL